MDIQNTEKRIKELKNTVAPYSEGKIKQESLFSFDLNGILSNDRIYQAVFAIVFILLLITRPSFIKAENKEKEMKMNFSKFLSFWLGISAILSIGIYGYNYKNNSNSH
jgi:hypothetical protein